MLKAKKRFGTVLRSVLIVLVLFIDIYPLFWVVTASFKTESEMVAYPSYSLNHGFHLQNYVDAWTKGNISIFFTNSVINTVISLVFIILIAVTMSFALVKMNWKGRKQVETYILFGMMIPGVTGLVPMFQIFNKIGLINTRASIIILYVSCSISFSVFLLNGFMKSVNNDILEAAVIDGCSVFQLLFRVVVPIIKNAIVTNLVIQFCFKWNDLMTAMTFVSSKKLKTIQTGLLYFSDQFGNTNWGPLFAAIVISILPMCIIYMFLNKQVIEGMTAGASKG